MSDHVTLAMPDLFREIRKYRDKQKSLLQEAEKQQNAAEIRLGDLTVQKDKLEARLRQLTTDIAQAKRDVGEAGEAVKLRRNDLSGFARQQRAAFEEDNDQPDACPTIKQEIPTLTPEPEHYRIRVSSPIVDSMSPCDSPPLHNPRKRPASATSQVPIAKMARSFPVKLSKERNHPTSSETASRGSSFTNPSRAAHQYSPSTDLQQTRPKDQTVVPFEDRGWTAFDSFTGFASVVCDRQGRWVDMGCPVCHANISSNGGYIRGINGFRSHIRTAHSDLYDVKSMDNSTLLLLCCERYLKSVHNLRSATDDDGCDPADPEVMERTIRVQLSNNF